MTSTALFQVVDPPSGNAPRGATLLRTANPVVETDPRWMQGLRWRPLVCGSSAVDQAILVCGGAFSGFATLDPGEFADYVPPSVAVGLPCSAISGEAELQETKDRAVALLDRCETLGIARELWTGTATKAETPDLPNDYLANDTTVTKLNGSAATHAIDALAWLEEAVAQASCAGGSMIHASLYTATVWASVHLLERTPTGLVTLLGTPVVADPGYNGSAPDGSVDATKATAWAYATGMVDVRRGPVQLIPPGRELVSAINRTNNDFNVYAYRAFAATFDPCAHVGIKVDHATRT